MGLGHVPLLIFQGVGRNKKLAKARAAQAALQKMFNLNFATSPGLYAVISCFNQMNKQLLACDHFNLIPLLQSVYVIATAVLI